MQTGTAVTAMAEMTLHVRCEHSIISIAREYAGAMLHD